MKIKRERRLARDALRDEPPPDLIENGLVLGVGVEAVMQFDHARRCLQPERNFLFDRESDPLRLFRHGVDHAFGRKIIPRQSGKCSEESEKQPFHAEGKEARSCSIIYLFTLTRSLKTVVATHQNAVVFRVGRALKGASAEVLHRPPALRPCSDSLNTRRGPSCACSAGKRRGRRTGRTVR